MRRNHKIIAGTLVLGAATLLAASLRRRNTGGADTPPDSAIAERKFAQVDGIRMSWRESGEGPPVILVHGIPTSPELWRDVLPQLSGVRALAWELVGYGLSIDAGKERDLSVAAQADYLAAWMHDLGIGQAILVGHDIGGGVVQQLAVRYPQLCSGVLLTNAIGYDSWPIPSVKMLQKTAALARHMPKPLFKALLKSLFIRGHDDPDAALAAYRVHGPRYIARNGAADLVRQIGYLDVNDTLAIVGKLGEIDVPTRLVWGEADEFQAIDYGRKFARDLDAPLRTIPGGKHFTPEDHPDIIAEEIMALVQTVHGSPAPAG